MPLVGGCQRCCFTSNCLRGIQRTWARCTPLRSRDGTETVAKTLRYVGMTTTFAWQQFLQRRSLQGKKIHLS
jgi:hypothetical protein